MTIDKEQYRKEPTIEELEGICARWDRAVSEAPIWGGQHPWESVYAHALLKRLKDVVRLQTDRERLIPVAEERGVRWALEYSDGFAADEDVQRILKSSRAR